MEDCSEMSGLIVTSLPLPPLELEGLTNELKQAALDGNYLLAEGIQSRIISCGMKTQETQTAMQMVAEYASVRRYWTISVVCMYITMNDRRKLSMEENTEYFRYRPHSRRYFQMVSERFRNHSIPDTKKILEDSLAEQ